MQFSKSVSEFCRRRAVELIDQGESKEVVLRVLGVSRTTLNIWLQKSRAGEDLVIIDHTEVHQDLQGLGIARRLLDTAVAWARQTKTRVSQSGQAVGRQRLHGPAE